jgi:hypothetical protein
MRHDTAAATETAYMLLLGACACLLAELLLLPLLFDCGNDDVDHVRRWWQHMARVRQTAANGKQIPGQTPAVAAAVALAARLTVMLTAAVTRVTTMAAMAAAVAAAELIMALLGG